MAKSKSTPAELMLAELVAIRRLLVFSLLESGASQKQIAAAMGVDQSQVSRMFPKGIGKVRRGPNKR